MIGGQGHQPSEYRALESIPPTIELLLGLIQRFYLTAEA